MLLATAREGQRRPTFAEAADLLRGALRMRLGLSHCPRTMLHAVRLMYLGALAEVAVLVSVLLSAGAIRASTRAAVFQAVGPHANPATTQQLLASVASAVSVTIVVDVVVALVSIAGFLLLAWANGKGWPLARVAAIIVCALYTSLTVGGFATGNAKYAPCRPDRRLKRGTGHWHRRGRPAAHEAVLALFLPAVPGVVARGRQSPG